MSTQWAKVGFSSYGTADWAGLGYSVVIDQTGSEIGVSHSQSTDGGPGVNVFSEAKETPQPSTAPFSSSPTSIAPNSSPSSSFHPSLYPTPICGRDFQIRTKFYMENYALRYNSTSQTREVEWCAGTEYVAIGSMIKNRPCNETTNADTQIWRRDEGGQIKLSRVNEDLCLKKTGSRALTLQTCDEVSNVSENRKFILSDEEHTITTVGRSNKLLVGFELDRKFSRLRLYEDGSLNGSLKTWETKYGPNFD